MFAAAASMALHAVLEIGDALPKMPCPDRIRLMLMASEAGEPAVVIVGVAGSAGGPMRAFKQEELGVIEMGGLPAILAVAQSTIRARAAVDRSPGHFVARVAFRAGLRQQQFVGEGRAMTQRLHRTRVARVAR